MEIPKDEDLLTLSDQPLITVVRVLDGVTITVTRMADDLNRVETESVKLPIESLKEIGQALIKAAG